MRLAHELGVLACVDCLGPLKTGERLVCENCGAQWPVKDGIPQLFREENVRGIDRLMRFAYNLTPSFHDPGVKYLLPLLQLSTTANMRDGYMRRLELGALRPRSDGAPLRILEVSIGSGANIKLIERDMRQGLRFELWGVDLSAGMLGICRRGLARSGQENIHLAMADAHALPFRDHIFDRVFHVGGIGGFRDPQRALAEMARVARPGTPIVVVDEQLDPEVNGSRYFRNAYRLVTLHDARSRCPVEKLPKGAAGVVVEQVSRFYYCMTFRVEG